MWIIICDMTISISTCPMGNTTSGGMWEYNMTSRSIREATYRLPVHFTTHETIYYTQAWIGRDFLKHVMGLEGIMRRYVERYTRTTGTIKEYSYRMEITFVRCQLMWYNRLVKPVTDWFTIWSHTPNIKVSTSRREVWKIFELDSCWYYGMLDDQAGRNVQKNNTSQISASEIYWGRRKR